MGGKERCQQVLSVSADTMVEALSGQRRLQQNRRAF